MILTGPCEAGLSVELEGDENNNSIAAPEEVQVKNESAASVNLLVNTCFIRLLAISC